MIYLVNSWIPTTKAATPARRLARLAEWLGELADLDDTAFAKAMVTTVFNARQRDLALIEAALGPKSDYPDHWQRDLKRYRDILLQSLRKPRFFVPVELSDSRSLGRGYGKTREFMRMSSESLAVWPTLWAEARRRTGVL